MNDFPALIKNFQSQRSAHSGNDSAVTLSGLDSRKAVTKPGFDLILQLAHPDMILCVLQRSFIDIAGNHAICNAVLHKCNADKRMITADIRYTVSFLYHSGHGRKSDSKFQCYSLSTANFSPDNLLIFCFWKDDEAFLRLLPQSDGYVHGLR